MGNIMDTLEMSEKMLCKGIDEILGKGDLNASNLELLADAMDTVKDIYSIREKAQGESYSRYMPQYYMNDGYGARQRDSQGRFMNDGYNRYNEGYNREYSNYGRSMDDERDYLKWKIQNSPNEQEREAYRRKLEMM